MCVQRGWGEGSRRSHTDTLLFLNGKVDLFNILQEANS